MKIYIATSWENRGRAESWAKHVENSSMSITYRWWEAPFADETWLSDEVKRELAVQCLRGVADADVVWILAPETGGQGVWVELGYSLAKKKMIVYSGPDRTIFSKLPGVTGFTLHLEALQFLQKWRKV
jgi:hypothetical protein